jgi:phosphatidylinositol glycan class F
MPLVDPVTMSTTLIKSGPAQQSAPKAAVPAIPLVNSPLALPASIAHSVLLAGLFYWRFDALVADPVTTLQTGLPVVAAIQAVYLMLSLPPAGSSLSSKKPRPGEKKKSDGREAKAFPVSI